MPVPPILIVAPPPITEPKGPVAPKFAGGEHKCIGLADALRTTAAELGCAFFDAGSVTTSSPRDGVHLDAAQHRALGEAMVGVVRALLPSDK